MQETAVHRIVNLLLAQQRAEITESEQRELDTWIYTSAANRQFIDRCLDRQQVVTSLEQMEKIDEEAPWQLFIEKNGLEQAPAISLRHNKPWRWVAAAAVIGVLAIGAYLYLNKGRGPVDREIAADHKGDDIQPGASKATLTLGDGRTLILDEEKEGTLAKEGGATIDKKNGSLVYGPGEEYAKDAGGKPPVSYNTVATPRGGYYELTLPDKTKVWLNAEASIRFPTAFTSSERRVEITGEAYFEVTPIAHQPFMVSINDMQVKVLGTHFNIRGYADEGTIKTTLLEGRVQVDPATSPAQGQGQSTMLKPGQQATLTIALPFHKFPQIVVQRVDLESVVAWKKGYFDFRSVPFADIMKEMKRWYSDIEVIDIKTPVNDQFTATIPRNVPLSTMLRILEETGKVHFEVKDKTVIVTQ